MSKKLKIGVFGCGRIGRLHVTNITNSVADAEVAAIADPFLNDDMISFANELGVTKCYKDPAEIINDPEIDAVFICTSTPSHVDLIVRSAKAGKHIFCEKPVHTDLDEIRKATAAAEEAGVKFQVGFVRRFDHNHKAVRDTVASGKLGQPHMVKVCSRDPDHPPMAYVETSGGIFVDMTIHDFDMVRYLSGSEAVEIYAMGAVSDKRYAQYDDVDVAAVMIRFENGALGLIDNDRASKYGYDQRTEVQCDKGCVQVSNDLNNTAMISTGDGVEVAKPTWFFLERYNNAFIEEEREFVKAILEDTDVPVNAHDGLMPVAMAIAATKSLKEGRPVKLAEVL